MLHVGEMMMIVKVSRVTTGYYLACLTLTAPNYLCGVCEWESLHGCFQSLTPQSVLAS